MRWLYPRTKPDGGPKLISLEQKQEGSKIISVLILTRAWVARMCDEHSHSTFTSLITSRER